MVIVVTAHVVGEAFHFHLQAGVTGDDAGNLGEFLSGTGTERVFAGIEEHVRHVHDEAASCVASLEDQVELA